jgi:HSP20 family protein
MISFKIRSRRDERRNLMFVRHTPLNEIESWLWDRTSGLSQLASNGDSKAPLWQPAVDVHENAERILLLIDLPGLEQNDLDITVDKNVLSIRGERKTHAPDDGACQHCERVQGPFTRAFTLPGTVDLEAVRAEMKSGVLTLTLPKKAEAKPRQIKIAST